jgi:hypothetical protein
MEEKGYRVERRYDKYSKNYMLEQTIIAIESGKCYEDERGKVYQQEFGESFVRALKIALES